MKHINEIPTYDELTEDQKKLVLLNASFLMGRISHLLRKECMNAPKDEDVTEDMQASSDLAVANLVIDAIMRGNGGCDDAEEVLDECFNSAKDAFEWLLDDEFHIAKAETEVVGEQEK